MLALLATANAEDSPRTRTGFLKMKLGTAIDHFCPTISLVGVDVVNDTVFNLLDVDVRSQTEHMCVPAGDTSNGEGR